MARAEDIPETGTVAPDVAEQLRAALDRGHALPTDLRGALFEPKREYELTYAEKQREADILAETMAVPLQPVKTFGSAEGEWSNKLILGDNLQVLKTLQQMKERGELTDAKGNPGITLVYIDPPFATQQEFRGARDEKAYQDKVAGSQFLEFLRKRLILLRELLTADGSLYVHLDTRKVHYVKVLLDEIFGEHNFRNEIIWKRTGAHSSAKRFAPVHDSILCYVKGPTAKWNPLRQSYEESYLQSKYRSSDERGRYRVIDTTGAGLRRGDSGKPWRGFDPSELGRHWAVPNAVVVEEVGSEVVKELTTQQKLDLLDDLEFIYWTPKSKRGGARAVGHS